jgi:hypothetical protein
LRFNPQQFSQVNRLSAIYCARDGSIDGEEGFLDPIGLLQTLCERTGAERGKDVVSLGTQGLERAPQ